LTFLFFIYLTNNVSVRELVTTHGL